MDKKPLYIGLCCLLVMFIGCGKKGNDDSASRNTTTKIVTGKIVSTPPETAEDITDTQTESVPPLPSVRKVSPPVEKASPKAIAATPEPPVEKQDSPSNGEGVLRPQSIVEDHGEVAPADGSVVDTITPSGISNLGATYDPTDKIDPFRPLFAETPTVETDDTDREPAKRREKRKPVTPLERVDLSQLTLVGIVSSPEKNRALVEEMDGKGYIVSIGTYIGINSGKVVQILRDRIVIEEEVEDVLGKISLQKRELKLQKPLGDE